MTTAQESALLFIFKDCIEMGELLNEIIQTYGQIEWPKRLKQARALLDNMEHFSGALGDGGRRVAEFH